MNFFKKREEKVEFSPVSTTFAKSNMHPFSVIDGYVPLNSTQDELYKCLREAIPIIDAGIAKIVRLIGQFEIECDDKYYEKELNEFLKNVRVNTSSYGVNSFI